LGGITVRGFEAMFAGFAAIYLVFLLLVPLSLAVPYVVLRMRDARSERPDPQLGLKAAMYFFFSLGIMLFLSGLTTLVVDLLVDEGRMPGGGLTEAQRISFAFMVAGLIFTLLHLGLVKSMTNDRNPAARRMFMGWRMAIHGLVILSVITALLVIYFQKEFGGPGTLKLRKSLWGVLLVWLPSWILHLVLLWVYSRPLYEPRRAESDRDWDR
jgi:hypothetical protein